MPAPDGRSSLHSNVAPASLEKAKDAVVAAIVPVGPLLIAVSGAVVSMVLGRDWRTCLR